MDSTQRKVKASGYGSLIHVVDVHTNRVDGQVKKRRHKMVFSTKRPHIELKRPGQYGIETEKVRVPPPFHLFAAYSLGRFVGQYGAYSEVAYLDWLRANGVEVDGLVGVGAKPADFSPLGK